MMEDQDQDTEVTLGTGKLLGIFFAGAVICGIFFSLGYAMGKNSTPAAGVAIMDSSTLSTVSGNGGSKPDAAKEADNSADPAPCAVNDANCDPKNSVAAALPENPSAAPTDTAKPAQPAPELSGQNADAPKIASNQSAAGTGFIVQVAAVSKAEDAEALKAALQKKQYPVFIVDNAASHLFHVQVGPFTEQKEAEAMKNKLSADGYNAILKR